MGGMERGEGLEDQVVLGTDVVLARTRLSPLAIARGRRAGRMAFKAAEGGTVFLEAGGIVVAEGRMVKRGGRSFFKLTRLTAGKGEESR